MADSDTFVQVQPNSTGAKVDCTLLDNGNVRQTVVIGDPAQNNSVASVLAGTLAAADVLDVGIGTPDNAGFVSVIGDPNGDFAGINLIEQLMDDASGLGVGVRILNQPKVGPDGALQITDGKRIDLFGKAGTSIIIDTLGYGSVQISSQTLTATNLFSSNDLVTFSQLTGITPSGISLTGLAVNTSYIYPAIGRYIQIAVSGPANGAGYAVAYLRAPSFPLLNAPQYVSLRDIAGSSILGTGASGALPVGGTAAASPGTAATQASSGSPVGVAGVDINNLIRRFLTDPTGAIIAVGSRLPPQPDTKTTNPLPAFVPPPPLKASINDDTPGPDTLGLLDALRLMTALLQSIDTRLQELPLRLFKITAGTVNASPPAAGIDTDDFPSYRDDPTLLSN